MLFWGLKLILVAQTTVKHSHCSNREGKSRLNLLKRPVARMDSHISSILSACCYRSNFRIFPEWFKFVSHSNQNFGILRFRNKLCSVISKSNTCRRVLFSKLSPFYRAPKGQEEADMSKTINLACTTAPTFCSTEKKKKQGRSQNYSQQREKGLLVQVTLSVREYVVT